MVMAKLRTLSRPDVAISNYCKVAPHDSEFKQQAEMPKLLEKRSRKDRVRPENLGL